MERVITAAALYFMSGVSRGVPEAIVQAALDYFAVRGLGVRALETTAADFSSESYYDFEGHYDRLLQSLRLGGNGYVGLYALPDEYDDPGTEWRGKAFLDVEAGVLFLGVERSVEDSSAAVLRAALGLTGGLVEVRYGIGYHRPMYKGPYHYAFGCVYHVMGYPKDRVEDKQIEVWGRELHEPRRHLRGWFRGAYPANLLSERHVNAVLRRRWLKGEITLHASGLGRLTRVLDGYWLWELSEEEIPVAGAALQRAGVLVC